MSEVKVNNLLSSLTSFGVELSEKKNALDLISKLDFPTRKTEDWRYTSVNKIIKNKYVKVTEEKSFDLAQYLIPGLEAQLVVLVNGVYSKELSQNSKEGVVVESFSDAISDHSEIMQKAFNKIARNEEEVFTAINTGYFNDGVLIFAPKNNANERPVHIIHVNTVANAVSNPRFLIVSEAFSSLNIIQTFVSEGVTGCFTNAVTEIFVGENAKVLLDKVQNEKEENNLICTEQVYQEKNSTFKINTITVSGDFVRNGLNIDVDGENCDSEMNGLYLMKGKQHVDNHTKVNHLKAHCHSSELYKGVLSDKATGVFNGKVIVHQDAQKIEAYQQNKNILLSKEATMNAKPELEIYADDVKCSHGTTTGQFDEEAMFYLQARGVSKNSAKKMLVEAFAGEVLDHITNEPLRNWLEENY